jgi:hypothetical protein
MSRRRPVLGTATIVTGLQKYQMGELPSDSNEDVPLATMIGFLSMGRTLAEHFDVDVVGRLAPMTSIGAIVE